MSSSRVVKTSMKSGQLNSSDITKLNFLFKCDLFNPIYNNFRPTYFQCSKESACDDAHKTCSSPINNTIKEMMVCLIDDKNWFPLYQSLIINVTPDYYLDEQIFRTILYALTDLEDESLYQRFVECLKVHLKIHSPCDKNMKEYYSKIINDNLTSQDCNISFLFYNLPKVLEELSVIMETLVPVKRKMSLEEMEGDNFNEKRVPYSSTNFSLLVTQLVDKLNDPSCSQIAEKLPNGLSSVEKLERLFVIFDIFMDIIDQDLYMFLVRRARIYLKKMPRSSYPMIVKTAWPSPKEKFGSVNQHCICIFKLLTNVPDEYNRYIYRYISMLAEIARINDKNRINVFPYFGTLCMTFACQLALHISNTRNDSGMVDIIKMICPMWLKMLVCYNVLDIKTSTPDKITLDSILQAVKEKLTNKLLKENEKGNTFKKQKRCSRKSQELNKEEKPTYTNEYDKQIRLFHLLITSYVRIYHIKSPFNKNSSNQDLSLELDPLITFDYAQNDLDNIAFNELFLLIEQLHLKYKDSEVQYTYMFLKNRMNIA
ncbi:uncharacterized protein LOC106661730 [Cimex lectularius]|uniref:Uncharacterized protein n=1 Tax=Cimex lectularius TaxID=79782 RepID=A0A8I6RE51_CIMLE|nr:uncharacterized protein LOC106661730 [Cimex lectularius]XP_014240775.1 uncharacterized protein LOC106661730 [Cimex lectularius]